MFWVTNIPVEIDFTCELNPSVSIIKKNKSDHSGATGIFAKPSGYTTNISPGPGKCLGFKCHGIVPIMSFVMTKYKTITTDII